jgi:hypothetical protein
MHPKAKVCQKPGRLPLFATLAVFAALSMTVHAYAQQPITFDAPNSSIRARNSAHRNQALLSAQPRLVIPEAETSQLRSILEGFEEIMHGNTKIRDGIPSRSEFTVLRFLKSTS